jgi:DNA-binding HxlR family transcriptional regulator
MEYDLTAAGRELAGALRLLADWGARRSDDADPVRHELCGTPLEARWYCPTCTVLVDTAAASGARVV